MVLSTLHTNSAIESLSRLNNLGIHSHNITNSLQLIISQRLIRKRCTYCKNNDGCLHCKQGYKGRVGIFEVVPLTKSGTLMEQNRISLWEAGLEKVNDGTTTLEELNRIL